MDKYEYVLAELKRRDAQRGQLIVIAENAHVTRRTLKNIIEGKFKPNMATVDALYVYLKENRRKKKLP